MPLGHWSLWSLHGSLYGKMQNGALPQCCLALLIQRSEGLDLVWQAMGLCRKSSTHPYSNNSRMNLSHPGPRFWQLQSQWLPLSSPVYVRCRRYIACLVRLACPCCLYIPDWVPPTHHRSILDLPDPHMLSIRLSRPSTAYGTRTRSITGTRRSPFTCSYSQLKGPVNTSKNLIADTHRKLLKTYLLLQDNQVFTVRLAVQWSDFIRQCMVST